MLSKAALAADEVLARLASIARDDIGAFLEFDDNGVIEVSLRVQTWTWTSGLMKWPAIEYIYKES